MSRKHSLIPLSTKAIYLTWLIQVRVYAKYEPRSRIVSQVVSSRFLETCHGRSNGWN